VRTRRFGRDLLGERDVRDEKETESDNDERSVEPKSLRITPKSNAVKGSCSRIRENSVVHATRLKSHDFGYRQSFLLERFWSNPQNAFGHVVVSFTRSV
jgi:hypothetical protein